MDNDFIKKEKSTLRYLTSKVESPDVSFDDISKYRNKISQELKLKFGLNEKQILEIIRNFNTPSKNLFFKNLNHKDSVSKTYTLVMDSDDISEFERFSLRTAQDMVKKLGGKSKAIEISNLFITINTYTQDLRESLVYQENLNTSLSKENSKLYDNLIKLEEENTKLEKENTKLLKKSYIITVAFVTLVLVLTVTMSVPFYIELYFKG